MTGVYRRFTLSPGWWRVQVLRKARNKRKLTQGELAEKVGVTRVTISYLESGTRQPSMDLLQRLAKVLKVKVGDLLK